MHNLTEKQIRVLQYIRDRVRTTGIPPTRAEITKALGLSSPNAAGQYLQALERKGAIELLPGTSRGIRVNMAEILMLPVIGQVAAGQPILAQEHIEAYHQVGAGLFKLLPDYLLRVRGLSMRDAGIVDNDLLAVHKTKEIPHKDQIVVARMGEEVTVKYFQRSNEETVCLLSANPDYKPIEVNLRHGELNIEGLAVGVIRNI